jgi:hypothetical protein
VSESGVLTREGELKVFLGFAAQPFAAALIAFVLFPVVAITGRGLYWGYPTDMLDAALSFAFGVGVAALAVTVFAALPVFLRLLRRDHISQADVVCWGALLGNIPSALIVLSLGAQLWRSGTSVGLDNLTYGAPGAARAIILGSVVGAGSASVFWWIAGRHLPGGR